MIDFIQINCSHDIFKSLKCLTLFNVDYRGAMHFLNADISKLRASTKYRYIDGSLDTVEYLQLYGQLNPFLNIMFCCISYL